MRERNGGPVQDYKAGDTTMHINEYAERYGFHHSTVRMWARRGHLKTYRCKYGTFVFLSKKQIEELS